jgi:hypothetical protein
VAADAVVAGEDQTVDFVDLVADEVVGPAEAVAGRVQLVDVTTAFRINLSFYAHQEAH